MLVVLAVGLVAFDPERVVALRRSRRVFKRRCARRHDPRRGQSPTAVDDATAPYLDWRIVNQDERARVPRRDRGLCPSRPRCRVILDGKKLLITGVITRDSIAWEVARQAQEAGAEVVLTGFGRARRMTERAAGKLPEPVDVLELDVNSPERPRGAAPTSSRRWGRSTACFTRSRSRPRDALGGDFLDTPAEQRARRRSRRARSRCKALTAALLAAAPRSGGTVVGLDFDAGGLAGLRLDGRREGGARGRLALPGARPRPARRARQPRLAPGRSRRSPRAASRLRAAGRRLGEQAPLGWDTDDPAPVAGAVCYLLSDSRAAMTGEIIHVDGGYHAMGRRSRAWGTAERR